MENNLKAITGDITPLPWKIEEGQLYMRIFTEDDSDVVATRVFANEDDDINKIHNTGKYIVKACNLFPDLVEALEESMKLINDLREACGEGLALDNTDYNRIWKIENAITKSKS